MLFSGWIWLAAGSLVGFEVLDLVLASLGFAPEMVPMVLLALALVWWLRERRAERALVTPRFGRRIRLA